MPYTPKQTKFFRAVEHGFKPTKGKYKNKKVLSPTRAHALLAEGESAGRAGYARGGPVRPGSLLTGRPLPRPGAGSNGRGLGATARVGAISGASDRAGSGLAAKPTGPSRAVGGGTAGKGSAKGSNGGLRPRPGRGVNPRLALSGTNHYAASDRLDKLRSGLRPRKP